MKPISLTLILCMLVTELAALATTSATAQQPAGRGDTKSQATRLLEVMKLGDTAKDIEFAPLAGDAKVKLSELTKDGPVVLVVLRGYPGYQCPLCTKQVAELRGKAEDFAKLGAKVVLVYPGPGPAENLRKLAREFVGEQGLPKPFQLMVDPEFDFTNTYGLRWNARAETSYPSTFVLDTKRVVKYRKISTTHGDRADTKDLLAVLAQIK